ncbi:hypothetical protein DVG79_08515 [Exiguobacterium sp. RIT594]|nr:hypothetical protein DVG79_08515 [Exiguobacterium sp. RIT594]
MLRVLLGLAWSCLVLLGLAWSCLVLLGLAWSCLVLLGLALDVYFTLPSTFSLLRNREVSYLFEINLPKKI